MAKTDDEQILICAVRYAHGRKTYVTGEASNWVKARWQSLSNNTKDVLKRDLDWLLHQATFSPEVLGMEMDARVWRDLRAWMAVQP